MSENKSLNFSLFPIEHHVTENHESLLLWTVCQWGNVPGSFIGVLTSQHASVVDSVTLYKDSQKLNIEDV